MRDDEGVSRPDPVIGHPTCDLDLQRRIRQTRRDMVASSVGRSSGKRSLLDRLLRRYPAPAPVHMDAEALRDHGDDVWKSLRF
jgi:hypothetical protein